ncbi:MAG: hypothetical protein CM15mP93_00070 [Thiotrichaceae bacterium]|nr:MAG: hypothetical protein CM15mP93_00070 [Thiotrichaceae bacterium]
MNVIGDVSDSTCVIVDDMVDTAGTLSKASVALKEKAQKVLAYATHPVLSGKAIENIENSEIDELVVTDTINLSDAAKASKESGNSQCHTYLVNQLFVFIPKSL